VIACCICGISLLITFRFSPLRIFHTFMLYFSVWDTLDCSSSASNHADFFEGRAYGSILGRFGPSIQPVWPLEHGLVDFFTTTWETISHFCHRDSLCSDCLLQYLDCSSSEDQDVSGKKVSGSKGIRFPKSNQTLCLLSASNRYLLTLAIVNICKAYRVKRMTCRLKSDRGSSVVRPRSLREV